MRKKIGEILIEKGLIDEDQLASGLGEQRQWGGKLGDALVKKGFVSEVDLIRCLAIQQGIQCVSLKDISVSPAAVRALRAEVAKKYTVMPLAAESKTLTIAMADPTDLHVVDTLRFMTGKNIRPVLAMREEILDTISKYYDKSAVENIAPGGLAAGFFQKTLAAKKKSAGKGREGVVTTDLALASLITLLIQKELISEQELLDILNDMQ